eukprot:Skav224348  [mRNA]  locus=scaffold2411:223991:225284:- [translate_table: standard]
MLPAGNDEEAVKPGGEFMTLVATAFPSSKSQCFEHMVHGWMNRGGSDPLVPQPAGVESVEEAQAAALKLAADFFQAHLALRRWCLGAMSFARAIPATGRIGGPLKWEPRS